MRYKKLLICVSVGISVFLSGCYEFESIQQPEVVDPGSTFDINISIAVNIGPQGIPVQSYYSLLLPSTWSSSDSFSYSDSLSGIYEYSAALSDTMESQDAAPLGYTWWTFVSSDSVDSLTAVLSFTQAIQTDNVTGLYSLDYRLGSSNDPDLSFCEDNDHFIWVGIDTTPIAADVYVNPNGSDANTGLSEAEPLKTIKVALLRINADSLNHRKIYLADGEYKASTNGEYFPIYLSNYVSLIGASQDGVILDAEGQHIVIVLDSVQVDTISNMTITGGTCCEYFRGGFWSEGYEYGGGGIYSNHSEVYLENLTIADNTSDNGGGISSYESNLSLRNVSINDNAAAERGGGLYFIGKEDNTLIMTDCEFIGNKVSGGDGGGVYISQCSVSLSNVLVKQNSAQRDGGGMLIRGTVSDVNLSSVSIKDNSAERSGGGIALINIRDHLALDNVLIADNLAGENGGGVICNSSNLTFSGVTITRNSAVSGGGFYYLDSISKLINATISGNSAAKGGGGISCEYSDLTISNTTIVGNFAKWGGITQVRKSNATFKSSILWNNLPQEVYSFSSYQLENSINLSYCDIGGGENAIITPNNSNIQWDENNFDADPFFCNPWESDYHLAENSPCVGAGENGNDIGALGVECFTAVVGLDEEGELPIKYALNQNYPNPFNPTTTISYRLPEQSTVNLTVFDIRGQEVITLLNTDKPLGNYEVLWNGMDQLGNQVSTGVYFCRLEASSFSQTIKMVYLR